jgi:hypothetical protein
MINKCAILFLVIFSISDQMKGQMMPTEKKKNTSEISNSADLKKELDLIQNQYKREIDFLENQNRKNIEDVVSNLKQAAVTVEILSYILLAFLAVAGIWNLVILKQEKRKLNKKFQEIKGISDNLFKIDKRIIGSQNYIHNGLEKLFDLVEEYASQKSERFLMDMVFKQKAVCNIYSFEENERFVGISILIERGVYNDIVHLEHVLFNAEECDRNKRLAAEAIGFIKVRSGGK